MVSGVLSYGMWGDYVTFTVDGNNNPRFTLAAGSYKWAALYEGEYTADTLPEYRSKGYSIELLECQRYYQYLYLYATTGFVNITGNDAYFKVIARPMRVEHPSVNILFADNAIQYHYDIKQYKIIPVSEIMEFASSSNRIRIRFGVDKNELPIYSTISIFGTIIELSADL